MVDDQNVNRQTVLTAIKAVKAKGWDVNPFTVADEAHIPPTLLYRNSEMMELILQERGESFGSDSEASLNVTSPAQQDNNLKDNVEQPGLSLDAETNLETRFGEGDSMSSPSQKSSTNDTSSANNADSSQETRKNGQHWQIYNLAKNGPMAPEFNPLAALTWKDIETVYYMKVSTLKDYASNIPGPQEESNSSWYGDQGGPQYRPYLSRTDDRADELVPETAPGNYRTAPFPASHEKPSNGDLEAKTGSFQDEQAEVKEAALDFGEKQQETETGKNGAQSAETEGPPLREPSFPGSIGIFSKAIEDAVSIPQITAEPEVAAPSVPSASPPSLFDEPVKEKVQEKVEEKAPEVSRAQQDFENEISSTPESSNSTFATLQSKPTPVTPPSERPSSPFVTSDNIPSVRIDDSTIPQQSASKSAGPLPGDDSSASPFQMLKTSASWPNPATSQKPPSSKQTPPKEDKANITQEPAPAPTPAPEPQTSQPLEAQPIASEAPTQSLPPELTSIPKVQPTAEEMMWGHFSDASPVSQPPAIKAGTFLPPEQQVPEKPFDVPQKTEAQPSLLPEQLAWGHFTQNEVPLTEAPQNSFGFPPQVEPFDQAKPPADSTAFPSKESGKLSAGQFGSPQITPDNTFAASADPSATSASDWSDVKQNPTEPDPSEAQIYSDVSLAGPHYSFGTAFGLGQSNRSKSPPRTKPEEIKIEAIEPPKPAKNVEANEPVKPFTFAPEHEAPSSPPSATVEEVPDLDALDIFDDLDNLTEMEEIEIIEEVVKDQTTHNAGGLGATISGDELRELIKNRIKQASEQLAEPPAEVSTEQTGEQETAKKASNRSKFVGAAKTHEPPKPSSFVPRAVPAEIRKACLLLGVRPEEITNEVVIDAWKRQIASPGVHPDLGGDTESAIFLNTAKDTLIRYLEDQAPKLGKRFSQTVKTRTQATPKKASDKVDKADKAIKAEKSE